MLRRSLVASIAAIPAVSLLAACGGRTASVLTTDADLIAKGAAVVFTDLTHVPGISISASDQTKILNEIALIETDAPQIGATLAPGQNVASNFIEAVNTLASLVTPYLKQAPAVQTLIVAIVSLAQTVGIAAGVLTTTSKKPALALMSAAAARHYLRSVTAR